MARRIVNQIVRTRLHDPQIVIRLGKQGILYEYVLPYGANPNKYYEEAIDVRSRKKISDGRESSRVFEKTTGNGTKEKYTKTYRRGQYQPVGDKRYFTYYQIHKMGQEDWIKFYEDLLKRNDERFLEIVGDVLREMIEQ